MSKFQKLMLLSAVILLSGNVAFCPPKIKNKAANKISAPENDLAAAGVTPDLASGAEITVPALELATPVVATSASDAGADVETVSDAGADVNTGSNADAAVTPVDASAPAVFPDIRQADSPQPADSPRSSAASFDVEPTTPSAPKATTPKVEPTTAETNVPENFGAGLTPGSARPSLPSDPGFKADSDEETVDTPEAPVTPQAPAPAPDSKKFWQKNRNPLIGTLVALGSVLVVNNRFYAWQERTYAQWRNTQDLTLQVVLPETLAELEDSIDEGICEIEGQYLTITGVTVELPKFGRREWFASFFRKANKPVAEDAEPLA